MNALDRVVIGAVLVVGGIWGTALRWPLPTGLMVCAGVLTVAWGALGLTRNWSETP